MSFSGLLTRIGQTACAVLVFALSFLPPLVFVPGRWAGQWIFTSYREPKLATIQSLSWGVIVVFFLFFYQSRQTMFWSIGREKVLWLLGTMSVYAALSASWALVPNAAFYEAIQWVTLTCLFWILTTLFTSLRWRHLALWGLWSSFGLVTAIGLLQTQFTIPWLVAVSEKHQWASTFGAKNTCFLSLTGQYFLLPYMIYVGYRDRKCTWLTAGAIFLVSETVYLFISQSRTAYVGIVGGLLILGTVAWYTFGLSRRAWKLAAGIALIFISGTGWLWFQMNRSAEIVYNSQMELSEEGQRGPAGWIPYERVGAARARNAGFGSWSDEAAHSGKFSLKLDNQTGSRVGWKGKEMHFAKPYPKALRFEGWSKAMNVALSDGRYGLLFKIVYEDGTTDWFGPPELRFDPVATGWQERSMTYSSPRNISAVQPYAILYACVGTAWFDDISARPIPAFLGRLFYFWDGKIEPYLLQPGRFFTDTVRGTAILDTFSMVAEHPCGVGAGNWGFAYPLYHTHMLEKAFSREKQIRRVHNDYIEYLGELGYVGLLLLLGLIIISLGKLLRILRRQDGRERVFRVCLLAQIVSCTLMLGLDYFLEYPFRKFLFVILLALASSSVAYQANEQMNRQRATLE